MASKNDGDFPIALSKALARFAIKFTLKKEQEAALKSFYEGKDTFCLLPTRFGKSIIYQLTPFLKTEDRCTLVLGPLNSILKDQVHSLHQRGIKSCYLDFQCAQGHTYSQTVDEEGNILEEDGIISVPLSDVYDYNLIYSHPEALLHTKNGKKILRSEKLRKNIACVAVDEVHMVEEWGDTNFRPAFSKIRDLISIFSCPVMVFTATATIKVQKHIVSTLSMKEPTIIKVNPDRENIFYSKIRRSNEPILELKELLSGFAKDMAKMKKEYPLTIMYMRLDYIAFGFRFMQKQSECAGMFAMFHKQYADAMKTKILEDLTSDKGSIRLVFASMSLGMGVDIKSARNIYHFGSPTSIEKYLQESGRAGRDGLKSNAYLYWNKTDIHKGRKGVTEGIQMYCRSESKCLRQQLVNYLGFSLEAKDKGCLCCDVCADSCQCDDCLPREHAPSEADPLDAD